MPIGQGFEKRNKESGNMPNSLIFIGGRSRDRTYDLTIKSRLLYQLSYAPV
jgi:hypothetical protein